MSIEIPNIIAAAGSVKGSDGSKVAGAGFVPARTSKGLYTLTLDQAIDATECAIVLTPRGAAPLEVSVAQTSDTVKTVNVLDNAAALADTDFDFVVFRMPQVVAGPTP